jgi:glucan endo-1,3-alpha-glucosidase
LILIQVGLTDAQPYSQWASEITMAKAAGIDGFALNIGPADYWTQEQLGQAYRAAEEAGDFVMFLSFDMAAGSWPVPQVVDLINEFRQSGAQMCVDGQPLVSTFEGPDWAHNWGYVREQTGGIFLVPDWTSIGPHGVGHRLGLIDGACKFTSSSYCNSHAGCFFTSLQKLMAKIVVSWSAWPRAGHHKIHTAEDMAYKGVLQGRKYMMGVSPHFYTRTSRHHYCCLA